MSYQVYLVDGNNVMGQRVGWHRDRAGARRRLVRELQRFARRSGATIEVVFDGEPDRAPSGAPAERQQVDAPQGPPPGAVRVTYAGRGTDADTRIRERVQQAPAQRRPVVVTSDRRLAADVRLLGAEVIRSGELRRQLDALPDGNGAADQAADQAAERAAEAEG